MENNSGYDSSYYRGGMMEIECIDFVMFMSFVGGNIFKYIWRAGKKGKELQDLYKAQTYLDECLDSKIPVFTHPDIKIAMIHWLKRIKFLIESWKYDILIEILNENLEEVQLLLSDRVKSLISTEPSKDN